MVINGEISINVEFIYNLLNSPKIRENVPYIYTARFWINPLHFIIYIQYI